MRAGADVIETNTFGANRVKLGAVRPRRPRQRRSTCRGRRSRGTRRASRRTSPARSARSASASSRGARPASTRRRSTSASRSRALLEGGVDLFVLETFRDVNEIGAAIRAVRSALRPADRRAGDDRGGRQHPRRRAAGGVRAGARSARRDVVGVNCSVGPAGMLETLERMARVAHVPLSAQPNAGRPREIEGRNLYLSSPEYMASYARRFIDNGVRLVGGCCGTTPEHIRQIKVAVRALTHAAAGAGAGGGARTRRRRRPRPRSTPVPRRGEVAAGATRSRAAVRRQRRADAAARLRRARRWSSRRGSCASTASTSSTSPTARAPARA